MIELTLASASPARYALLCQLGISCMQLPTHADESSSETDPKSLTRLLARRKLAACLKEHPHAGRGIILAADTVVTLGEQIIGKAESRKEASGYLTSLSGAVHRVVTGYAVHLPSTEEVHIGSAVTEVTFHDLSQDEIDAYLDSGEWEHAAGAYRIQGRGGLFVRDIQGSFWNIVGLPIEEIFGIIRVQVYPHVVKGP